ncbi:VOC family protein [Streptomyces litmocidini]|uniref:VOC family protein n=1 Tax=Streptomyces litmocidini TaxID=67318 RepID=A0ABW7U6I3_9ACTN|nr:VOC family protein [Streptomyces sp. PanSC19]ROQ26856.1 putative enzyme related to lactoylglutathione lyase [Streptomyces sp. PanSC19]
MLSDSPIAAIIPVNDMNRAKQFYSETLGLSLTKESPEDTRYECGGTIIGLYETPYGGQASHTLASWKVDDLDGEMKELRSRGVTFEEYDLPGIKTVDGVVESDTMRGAWFKDSEGNILCVMEERTG